MTELERRNDFRARIAELEAERDRLREDCAQTIEAYIDSHTKPAVESLLRHIAKVIRALDIPSPPAEATRLPTFGPPDAGYYREETP